MKKPKIGNLVVFQVYPSKPYTDTRITPGASSQSQIRWGLSNYAWVVALSVRMQSWDDLEERCK